MDPSKNVAKDEKRTEKPVPNLACAKLVDSTPRIANINESASKDCNITVSAAYPVQKDSTPVTILRLIKGG
jgi:hypothetical protein